MRLLQRFMGSLALVCGVLAAAPALAQADYPNKPIKWIVPYPPGGTTDILARLMAQYLSGKLGQQVIVENRAGGGNNIGTDAVAKAAPDGYTILLVNPANAINRSASNTLIASMKGGSPTALLPNTLSSRLGSGHRSTLKCAGMSPVAGIL
jgi:tripartite-type tricarboxylate transporter receptor subunit TctC